MSGIAGILLAAGASARFGSSKLVAPLADGAPVVVAAARGLVAVLPDSIAVIRPGDGALRLLLEAQALRIVECDRARDGMGFSLAAGVAAVADRDGWVIALADMPWIKSATLRRVVGRLAQGARVVAPAFRGRRGHPVGFGAEYREELLACQGDQGARPVLQRHAADVAIVDVDDAGVVTDVDVPADLATPR